MKNDKQMLSQLPTLFRTICTICSVSKTTFLECLNPHFVVVGYFTHTQICNPNYDYGLKY